AQADIYQWTDANGKVHYTDRPNDTAVAKAGGTVTKIETKVNTFEPVDAAAPEGQPVAKTVEMYATKWCGYCKKARRYMAQKGIAYIEYDIEADAAANARHKALGGRGVPLILVDGRRLNGFSESGFERVYNPK
ncbi:MAG TPA: glutaredoxin domain-containing protein, partial [Marinagarivorans sp.]